MTPRSVLVASWVALIMSAYVGAVYLFLGLGQFAAPSPAALAALHIDPWWAELLRGIPQLVVTVAAFRLVRQTGIPALAGLLLLAVVMLYHLASSAIRLSRLPHLPAETIASAGFVVVMAIVALAALGLGLRHILAQRGGVGSIGPIHE